MVQVKSIVAGAVALAAICGPVAAHHGEGGHAHNLQHAEKRAFHPMPTVAAPRLIRRQRNSDDEESSSGSRDNDRESSSSSRRNRQDDDEESESGTGTRTGTRTGTDDEDEESTSTGPTGAFSAFSGTLAPSISSLISTITSGTETNVAEPTPTQTYAAGAVNPSISNAPPLPDASLLDPGMFPALDRAPDPMLPLSQQFLNSVDLSDVPDIALTTGKCEGEPLANSEQNHWWTCGGWTVASDVTVCPEQNTWGLSYDDGPSPYTPQLLRFLDQNDLKTTFFIVGSRALSRPQILREEYMGGHQLSVHTWSHPYLTTLSNEQIVLELAWTKYVIQQVTGVTPLTMRPPYGDIDDRVRAICRKLALTPIIWTSLGPGQNYDTNDWRIGSGQVSAAQSVQNFEYILGNSSLISTGYIVLEHDLYKQSVELATEVVLPMALAMRPRQTLEPIVQCLGLQLGDAYVETNRNATGSGGASSPDDSNPTSGARAKTTTGGGNGNFGSGAGATSTLSYASAAGALLMAAAAVAL